jgi:glycosyltransferase involved in cell wall biosynthesis
MKRPLKVLFCTPSISRAGGGVSEAARLQALALAQSGNVEVSVMTFDDPHVADDIAGWLPIRPNVFRAFSPRSFSFSPAFLFALLRERPDVIHVHGVWQFHCLAVYLWSLLTGRPYVVTPHGMLERWIRARSPKLKWVVSTLYQNRFLKRAAAFQLLTVKESDDVAEFLDGQAVEIIPNYVPAFQRDTVVPNWWRADFSGKDIYLFLGRIHEKKGCIELCDAWDQACRDDPGFRDASALVFCGWTDGLAGFEKRVGALDIAHGNAIFAGPQYGPEKRRSMSAASFFLLPSKSEGLPMAILEAWSASVPVIMTKECNLPLGFERHAALETGADIAAIATSLRQACALSVERRRELADNGLRLVQDTYSAGGVRSALIRLYNLAIGDRGRTV